MEKYKSRKEDEEKALNDLMEIPSRNLENKINEIELSIKKRRVILDNAISNMDTRISQLKENLHRVDYLAGAGTPFDKKTATLSEMAKTQLKKIDSCVSYFRDMEKLKDKLREAKEELAIEEAKQKLIKD